MAQVRARPSSRASRPKCWGFSTTPGYRTLNDILDLEREDIEKVPGMTPAAAEELLAFLADLVADEPGEGAPQAS